jgi:hypothetical protein
VVAVGREVDVFRRLSLFALMNLASTPTTGVAFSLQREPIGKCLPSREPPLLRPRQAIRFELYLSLAGWAGARNRQAPPPIPSTPGKFRPSDTHDPLRAYKLWRRRKDSAACRKIRGAAEFLRRLPVIYGRPSENSAGRWILRRLPVIYGRLPENSARRSYFRQDAVILDGPLENTAARRKIRRAAGF